MNLRALLLIFTAAVVACFVGFYNNFPLVFPDTGTYISSGFYNEVPIDRPIFYGWFLRHVSLAESLWLAVLGQSFLLALLLYYFFRQFVEARYREVLFLGFVFFCTLFTGLSVHVSALLPDIFAPMMMLGLGLLLLGPGLKVRDQVVVGLILFFSMAVHYAHLFTAFLILGAVSLLYVFYRKRALIRLRPLVVTWGVVLLSALLIPTTNWMMGAGFGLSQGGHVFLMQRFVHWGVLEEYLDDACPEKEYRFCEFKDEIPRDFLWNPESPLYKTGGWLENKREYQAITHDILTDWQYLRVILARSLETSVELFFSFDVGDTTAPQLEGSSPFETIKMRFPEHQRRYLFSRQSFRKLDFTLLNYVQQVVLLGGLFISIILLLSKKITLPQKMLIGFFLICLAANAVVCGPLSGVFARYQSRAMWLLLLPLFVLMARYPWFGRRWEWWEVKEEAEGKS
ncbi:MAG: hypothetical protein KDD06_26860 [Phaeodactylibacter sp.]|nr:hypothetical protein [Phaeodactylibacter sp.]MCB9287553.1 hypothetical protein [Lewinellaceae bacterium]